ncbi:TIGR02302 family protein [Palleronia sp. LCG004]|uniref:TIGR02302 family protein n=1 Tax=Palleronia sp. LCG004 TaxID=3079304 RepID=UPI002943E389|nr:TIGR02302 family protein [Palleronia sp. LCG004]WOI56379.1 TIGR02302 family protein [Palleronia sp. LCG004]
MPPTTRLPETARRGLRRPLFLTRAGMAAERGTHAFWPLWTLGLVALASLMLGLHEAAPLEIFWIIAVSLGLAGLWALIHGSRRFRWPSEADALVRLDESLKGRPITALTDAQVVGSADSQSRALWDAHVARMAERIRSARAVRPDLRVAARDPFALRYVAVLAFAVAVLFGSILRVGSVVEMGPGGGQAAAQGPSWEGWIEPPAYTGLPSLYLADLPSDGIELSEGANVTIRLYGQPGDLDVSETVSAQIGGEEDADAPLRNFRIAQEGEIAIDGPGGRRFEIALLPDAPPAIRVTGDAERAENGQFRQPYAASDDYGVTAGSVEISLDLDAVDRTWGLATEPDPREPLAVDLPLPISGDRSDFTGTLVENFSEHPWANLPVRITYHVTDELGQEGASGTQSQTLLGLRFFDPMAQAIVEQRRDLLWARENATRVAQVLRAVSYEPDDAFPSESLYLKLRVAIRRLEAEIADGSLSPERQNEIAAALWDIANELEYGDLADALDRLRRAQERLSEAMENGADEAEIAELMQELSEAMNDYIRQLAEQNEGQDQQQAEDQQGQEITGNQLQEMMDQIQELMEQGRMAEAQALLEQLNRMMENMQVTQGQGGQGQPGPGEQAMQNLQQTLRDQQNLSDEAFRDLQERFGQQPGGQQGQQPGQQPGGQQQGGEQGQRPGQQPGGDQQGGTGAGQGDQPNGPGDLADRQQALRDELDRQRGNLPGAGSEAGEAAREALDRAGRAMDGAEESLRNDDYAGALDDQSDAMEALREGMRSLGEAMAEEQGQPGQGMSTAEGDPQGRARDPLGREAGRTGSMGSEEELLNQEDIYRRAEELLDEIRRRSGEQARPEAERDYLRRLLDRF